MGYWSVVSNLGTQFGKPLGRRTVKISGRPRMDSEASVTYLDFSEDFLTYVDDATKGYFAVDALLGDPFLSSTWERRT